MATIHELHKKLVNKEISAVELTNAVIAHKAKVEPTVHAYLSDSHDRALATAKLVDEAIAKGEAISPLAGIPGAIKDNICIKDEPATCASKMLENFVYKRIIMLVLANLTWTNLLWVDLQRILH